MRLQTFTLTSFFTLFLFSTALFAQPVNDDCSGLIDLGIVPICTDDIYDNIDATASDIGFGNIPACFEGGTVQNDIWFSFTTDAVLLDLTITVQGVDIGPNTPLLNPQIAVYRGDCTFDGLSDLGLCGSANDGESVVAIDIIGLTPNTTYFIRINDYSATATPNWGDFQLCIEEFIPAINIGDSPSTTSCSGTLYDSGGPDGDHGNNENETFTIQPSEFFGCLELQIVSFSLENNNDFLNFYAGTNTAAPLIASYTGNNLNSFAIQTDGPVTVEFISDFSVVNEGFELTWQCSGLACTGSSFDNPTIISGVPFSTTGNTTCGAAATFAETPCGPLPFMNGPEYVFEYQSEGGFCANVTVSNAEAGTGVLILNGPPDAPDTECVGQNENGAAMGVDFNTPGTYYIVIANSQGCTGFDLSIEEAECVLNPSLSAALCNPLNGCIEPDNLPSIFSFNQGFQDIEYNQGVNSGCWNGVGSAQPNFYWFTIEAQAAGPFGFTVEAALAAEDSDIDFNVWGPFTNMEVCEAPNDVIDFIENNQPIRSSWAGGADPTGLASIHPVTGIDVTDEYDCNDFTNPGNLDDFASVIDCQPGEIYVVLINDWGNNIQSGAISVDWSASADSVLAPIPATISIADTALCEGEAIQLLVESSVDNITWIEGTESLSCLDCLDPLANPTETTQYVAVVDAVCYQDTVDVLVEVFDVDAGPDVTICLNEEIQLFAGSDFANAGYTWDIPAGIIASCTDCPDPVLVADVAGTYTLSVSLQGPNCLLQDEMVIEVLPQDAATYNIAEDQEICQGESVNIGGQGIGNNAYAWISNPLGFVSADPNPIVSPQETTTYFISVLNGLCPVPSIDSVQVTVFIPPTINIPGDTAICQDDPIQLGNTEIENNVIYSWEGPPSIEDTSDPNTIANPQASGTYTLTAVRGACTEIESFEVDITPIAIEILSEDSLQICRGDQVDLTNLIIPGDSLALWSSTAPGFTSVNTNSITVAPESVATYYAEIILEGGCTRIDSVVILVDSLPSDMIIMPLDTTVCQGEILVLSSTTFEPGFFPNIDFEWQPSMDYQTADSLYNMVIVAPPDTTTYERIVTNGVCTDTSRVTVNVDPVPTISISPLDTTICIGGSVQLLAEINEDADGIEWTTGVETLSCDDCLDPIATPTGNTTYSAQPTGSTCPSSASVQVTVVEPPTYSFPSPPVICLGESIVLNTISDNDATYTWTSTDPTFGTVTEPAPEVAPGETTTYFLAATNGICDTVFDEVTIEVIPNTTAIISSSANVICSGDDLTLSADVEGGATGDVIIWLNGNGEEIGEGVEITITPNESDTYSINYLSVAGCEVSTNNLSVDVLPEPIVEPASDTVICLGESVLLNSAFNDPTEYIWTSTDPNFNDFDNPQPIVAPAQTSTYTLFVTNGICEDIEIDIIVEVISEPSLEIIGPIGFVCEGDEVILVADVTGGSSNDSFQWEGSDGSSLEGDTISFIANMSLDYDLTYISGGGCDTILAQYSIEVEEGVSIEDILVDPDSTTYVIGDLITLTALYNTNIMDGLTFSWFINDSTLVESGIDLESIDQQLLTEEDFSIFTVTIETPSGCSASLSDTIQVDRPMVDVPNVFTPNGDMRNDFFNIVSTGENSTEVLEIVDFQVYNRWGQQVYDNDTPDTGWDGTFNGKEQPTEAYFYQIKVVYPNGQTAGEFQGSVTLVR